MSTQTSATILGEWSKAVALLDRIRRVGKAGGYPAGDLITDNITGLINTLQTAYAGDWLDEEEDTIQGIRSAIAGTLSQGVIAAVHRPFLRQYCKDVIGRTDLQSDIEMWLEMYRYTQANNIYVQSRKFTFGTPTAAAANVGTQQILRLTRDRYNFPIEAGYVDSKRALCIADSQSGTGIGQEVFEIKGQAPGRDQLERSGSGFRGLIAGQTIDDSLINNAGFRSFGGTAGSDAPTSLNQWTSTTLAGASQAYNSTNYGIDQTNYFRAAPSDGTPGSLVIKTSAVLTQLLEDARVTGLDADTPYMMAVIWNRQVNSATGTLVARMGSKFNSVTVAAQTGWQILLVPSSIPLGQGCWFKNFNEAALDFQIVWTQTGGTGLLIAEVLFIPATFFDSMPYFCIPSATAAYVAPRLLDQYTWPDIATGSAKNQTFIHRGFPGVYLPSSDGSSLTFTDA